MAYSEWKTVGSPTLTSVTSNSSVTLTVLKACKVAWMASNVGINSNKVSYSVKVNGVVKASATFLSGHYTGVLECVANDVVVVTIGSENMARCAIFFPTDFTNHGTLTIVGSGQGGNSTLTGISKKQNAIAYGAFGYLNGAANLCRVTKNNILIGNMTGVKVGGYVTPITIPIDASTDTFLISINSDSYVYSGFVYYA